MVNKQILFFEMTKHPDKPIQLASTSGEAVTAARMITTNICI